jgi:hypothetical protein
MLTYGGAVSSLLPLLLSSPSFGVLHADNGYYSGSEVHAFEGLTWAPLYTRQLQGFLGPPRNRPRRYFDQVCSRMLMYAGVCWRMLAYADVSWGSQT